MAESPSSLAPAPPSDANDDGESTARPMIRALRSCFCPDNHNFDIFSFVHVNDEMLRETSKGLQSPDVLECVGVLLPGTRLDHTFIKKILHHAFVRAAGATIIEQEDTTITHETVLTTRQFLDGWFDRLWTLHTETNRYYHTVMHLFEMYVYLQAILQQQQQQQHRRSQKTNDDSIHDIERMILLSIFFHDAIYDVQSCTNEEASAELFIEFTQELGNNQQKVRNTPSYLSTRLIQAVEHAILATKSHSTTSSSSSAAELSNDGALFAWTHEYATALFLDLDMAVVGKNRPAYLQYAALIRREYAHVPHDLYCEKRADVLEGFLSSPHHHHHLLEKEGGEDYGARSGEVKPPQPPYCKVDCSIYATAIMRRAFEESARGNLRAEIASLRQGIIPQ